MADNIGNVNLSLGIDMARFEAELKRIEADIVRIKGVISNQIGGSVDTNATNRIKNSLKQIEKAFDMIPLAQRNKAALDDVNTSAGKLVDMFLRLKRIQGEAGVSGVAAYARQYGGGTESALTMAKEANTIRQRRDAIAELRKAQENLSTTDVDYTNKLRTLNREMLKLAEANKKAASSGVEAHKQTMKFGDAAAWATRKLAFYTSIFALERFVNKLVEVRGEFELQQKSLAAIIGNKEEADKIFGRVVDLALQSPFKLKELIGYTRELSAYRIETEKLFDTTKMLADVSAGLGVDMGRLILAYGQVRSAAVLRGQELRQFTEAGIPIIAELSKSFSELYGRVVKTGEVFDLVSKRAVSFEMVDAIFKRMTASGGAFYEMQRIQAETLKGKVSNLQDAYDVMLNKLGKESEGTLKGMIDSTTTLLKNYELVLDNLGFIVTAFGVYKVVAYGSALATDKYSASVVRGTGALSIFRGETYAATMATLKANTGMKLGAATMNQLRIATLSLNAAMQSLKAAFASFLPAAAIMAAIEFLMVLNNNARRLRELREATDENNVAVLNSTKTITDNIEKIKSLVSQGDGLNRNLGERARIIAEVTSVNGALGQSIEDVFDKQKTQAEVLKELNRLQEEQNRLAQLQVVINEEVLDTASFWGGGDIKSEMNDLLKVQGQLTSATSGFNGQWMLVESNIKRLVKNAARDGKTLSAQTTQDLNNILNSSKSAIEKYREFTKNKGLRDIAFSGGILSIGDAGIENADIAYQRVEALQREISNNNKDLNKSVKSLATNVKNSIIGSFGEISNLTKSEVKQINNMLEETFGKQLALKIRLQLSLPQSQDIPKLLTGWKFDFQKILKASYGEIVQEGMGLVESLDEVSKSRDAATKKLEVLNNTLKTNSNLTDYIKDKTKEEVGAISNKISAYDAVLKRYGYITKAEKGELKDANKDRVNAIKREVEAIKKAQDAYERFKKVMKPDKALQMASSAFGVSPDKIGSIDKVSSAIDKAIKDMSGLTGDAATAAVADFSNELGKIKQDITIDVEVKGVETIKDQIDALFTNYEATMEFKDIGGTDMTGLLPTTTSYADLYAGVNAKIKELREKGGEDAIALADKYEKELADVTTKIKRANLEELASLREQFGSKALKLELANEKMAQLQIQKAYFDTLKAKGLAYDKSEAEANELRIKGNQMVLDNLNEEALKSTQIYQKLFSDITTYSVGDLFNTLEGFKKALSEGSQNKETGNFEFTLDGKKMTLSMEAYLRILKEVDGLTDNLSQKNPFKAAAISWGKVFKKDSVNDVKDLGDALSNTGKALEGIAEVSDGVGDIAGLLGASEQTSDIIQGIGDVIGGVGQAAGGVGKVMKGDLSGVVDIVKGVGKAIGGIITISDAKYKAIINEQKKKIKELEYAYEKLEKEMEKAFNLSKFAGAYKDMKQNLIEQQVALNRMREAESMKKKKDKGAMDEYNKQLDETKEKLKELKEEFFDEMRGTDLQSASEEFASAWVDAMLQGEDAMDAFGDKFDDMVKQMIVKQASLRVMGDIMKSIFDDIDLAIGEEGEINASEIERLTNQFPMLMQQMDNAMKAIIKPLLDAAGLTQTLGGSGKSGLQMGISTIQEETAGQLVALLNTMRYVMYKDSDKLNNIDINIFAINSIMSDSLAELRGIGAIMREIRQWQQSITFAGHPSGGNGLKVFTDN